MPEIMDWQTLRALIADESAAVLDLRDAAAFGAGHWPGSASAPLVGPLPERLPDDLLPTHLLPPRHEPLLLLGEDAATLARVQGWLHARGRPRVMVATPAWTTAPADGLETGPGASRLWRPPPWLEEYADHLPDPSAGPAIDLGCGNGRAVVWLAERGFAVTAVDRHAEALDRTVELAGNLVGRVNPLRADLTDAAQWPRGPWSVAVAMRFLHRPLLQELATMMAPGAVVFVRTFRWVEGPWTLPRRHFCLEPGELETLFAEPDWSLLAAREDEDADGRPAAGVVARRV